jgi:hypothetical protein
MPRPTGAKKFIERAMSDQGFALFAVLNDRHEVIASGYSDSVDDAIPDLKLSMLPPEHPDFDAGPVEP